jgi:hypothetical protein
MVRDGLIDAQTAVDAAADPEYVKNNTGLGSMSGAGGFNKAAGQAARPAGGPAAGGFRKR